jgi:aspartate/glutamate/glutamine transport system substrate-binding protein
MSLIFFNLLVWLYFFKYDIFMIKKIILLLICFCFIFSGCGKKTTENDDFANVIKRDKLIVGVRDDAPPFGFKDEKGNLIGYDIDLAKIIAKDILGNENKVEFVPVTASNRIMKLSANEVDFLIATMSITNQRQQILDFSVPYYVAGQAILVNSSSKATSLSDFEGKKLIIVFGSTSERNLRTNVPEVTVIGYKNYNDAYRALKQNRADGIVADDTILLNYALKDKSVKLLPKRYSKEPYAVVFRKEKESERLLIRVNHIIGRLASKGQLNRLQEKWHIK